MASDPFVPLTTAPAALGMARDFRVLVAEKPELARVFRPQPAACSSATPSAEPPNPVCEPCVSLQRDGDRVTAIRVQCSCGQVIDLACVY
jgi:hypothetical protein